MVIPRALTIAGSDSGGGAGIQADLKTFAALGVFGTSAITALTAQNTCAVTAVVELDPQFVAAQIDAVAGDIGVDAAKTGMLANAAIIETVAQKVREHRIERLVVDPVMVAKSGASLLRPEAVEALRRLLLPLALVVTPNLPEASVLVGHPIRTEAEMEAAARRILTLGPRTVVVKGGHLQGSAEALDLFFDGQRFRRFVAPRIPTTNTHGTGCVFSAAIAAGLAQGLAPAEAVARAKRFVTLAIKGGLPLGRGHGPANPMAGWPRAGPGRRRARSEKPKEAG
ncbi:MAG: bifunctional hydroxymethylpyrimidine kinase/phosphomethylpyrimidine kinase [Armatimonadota bacterium]|nr:bifunctional hydroxymethylpyrimidine kinase/phosphomethylpyrimidine kinase [Armatimonadota bacterium]MDR7450530.1 bifunctional hydroxymethylpyrimidine kinase/phosphomethylpyrimidine kinase [Armatimonadota bacterium]MDR7466337.1 bifunctional hydroxymethylpyrimidine kinase/phosphomethylpyrimidine kinase [Armatimonadota bacterium]MDR7493058.1 bifunctional hydroxymethylpyrimidine kinase/phosphomethylpyrimidine kinase [Armatimonadota bacterium]MDR7498185.1 bifunctional hydroxymethylpyrimidine kin